MPAAVALVALATVAAGTTAYNAYQSSQAKSEAIDEKGRQETLAAKAQTDAYAQDEKVAKERQTAEASANTADAANALRLMQQRRRNGLAGGLNYTKGGTLLTGPQGLGSGAPINAPTKTLLGQ